MDLIHPGSSPNHMAHLMQVAADAEHLAGPHSHGIRILHMNDPIPKAGVRVKPHMHGLWRCKLPMVKQAQGVDVSPEAGQDCRLRANGAPKRTT